jgi:hypothetical protein
MLLTIIEILAVLAFIAGAVAAALNYLGGSTLYLVLQLWWQGMRSTVLLMYLFQSLEQLGRGLA